MGGFARRDLEVVGVQCLEKGDAVGVEGGGKKADARAGSRLGEIAEGLERQFQLLHHLEHVLAVAGGGGLVFGLRRTGPDRGLRAEGLELDVIGAGICRGADKVLGQRDIAVVVYAGFGDDDDVGICGVHAASRRWKLLLSSARKSEERSSTPTMRAADFPSP